MVVITREDLLTVVSNVGMQRNGLSCERSAQCGCARFVYCLPLHKEIAQLTRGLLIPIVQGRDDTSQGKWCFFFLIFKFLCVGISSYSTSCPTCTENDHVRTRGEGNAQQGKTLACSSWLFPFVVTRFWMGELMGRYRSFWAVGRFRLFQSVSGRFLG